MNFKKNKQKLEDVAAWYSTATGLNAYMIFCVFKEIKKYINSPLLEVGAADGYMTDFIRSELKITDYDIVEASSSFCARLGKKHSDVHVINTFIEDYKSDKKYKSIIASHILEHIDEVDPFLRAIHDLLLPGGLLLVSVPNALSFHRLLGVEMGLIKSPYHLNDQDKKIGHFRVYDQKVLTKHLIKNNFKIKKIYGSFAKFLSNTQVENTIPREDWKYFYSLGKRFPENAADIIAICEKK